MPRHSLNLLCSYRYDPLDRLVASTPSAQASAQRFYLKDRLATEIQGTTQHSILQHDDQLLAQQQRQSGSVETRLLATDTQRSVLNVLAATQRYPLAYTPYGHRPLGNGLLSLLGFNGERPDPVTGWYLLGNGYRAFNSVLMRFNSPDGNRFSPFARGGLNAYAYCLGDPINYGDRTGHMRSIKALFSTKKAINNKVAVSPHLPPSSNNMKNITKLGENAYTFEDTYKGQSRISIVAHGSEGNPGHLVNGTLWGADDIIKNVDFKPFDHIRVAACYSDELGALLALKTRKPVKAYIGRITTDHQPEHMMKVFSFENTSTLSEPGNYGGKFNITKNNPFDPVTENEKYLKFKFQSVRFDP